MKNLQLAATFLALLSIGAASHAGERTTVIKERDGSTTTVKTDSGGTTVKSNGQGVYTSGGDRHQDQVDHSTQQGGTITSDN